MSANRFGHFFSMTTFGESHGPGLGVVIDGCPAGVKWNENLLLQSLERRRPGQSKIVSGRQEADRPEILSGVFEGQTLGTPIAMWVRNGDAKSEDYKDIANNPRRGHADDVWRAKFGHVDPRGGGRSSGRETVSRVMAGAVAQMLVQQLKPELRVIGFASQIGELELSNDEVTAEKESLLHKTFYADQFAARLPNKAKSDAAEKLLSAAKSEGHSYGGVATIWIESAPQGLGRPVFHKLKNDLANAVMSIGATNAVSFGDGFEATRSEGSKFHQQGTGYGGLRGGISTGETIEMHASFKPTASVLHVAKKGRHDPCIVPRAIPVIESMVWLVLADQMLAQRLDRI